MANMMDYMEWRGDLSFEVSVFNEVDNLILAQLVYVELDGIVPGVDSDSSITLKEASEKFWREHDEDEILARASMMKWAPFVMQKMAETERFSNIRLSKYVNEISDEEQSQFSVVCVTFPDDSIYVAFCGTDSTIVGWHENFNMGYLLETPGQLKAVDYLNKTILPHQNEIRIGGHSKGGNLSVYAAVNCREDIKERILAVYSNDGPGFRQEVVESEAYQQMLPKIKTILPESSIVGMLLEHQESFEVVKSSHNGIQQHDMMSWEVLGPSFVYVNQVALQSIMVDKTMKACLNQLNSEERQQIVDEIFHMLEEANIRTIDDFYNSKWKKMQELMKAKSKLPEEKQKLFSKALKLLWSEGNKTVRKTVKKAMQERREERPTGNYSEFLKKV